MFTNIVIVVFFVLIVIVYRELTKQLNGYINKCCEVSWLCVLHRPILNLYPKDFWMNENENKNENNDETDAKQNNKNGVIYDENIHSRCNGSDLKNSNVLYCVWPVIRENQTILQKEKINVFTKKKPYKEDDWQKKKK